jgi:hypothetical protein
MWLTAVIAYFQYALWTPTIIDRLLNKSLQQLFNPSQNGHHICIICIGHTVSL